MFETSNTQSAICPINLTNIKST